MGWQKMRIHAHYHPHKLLEKFWTLKNLLGNTRLLPSSLRKTFRQYNNFLSVCELNFLVAIGYGRITTAPIQVANTTIELKDFFSGDDSPLASFDLDQAIWNLNHERAAPSQLGGEPMNANSGNELNQVENASANIASIQSDTATSSPPAARRPQSHSAGRTVFNQKEGNQAIPSPSQMVLQLPINLGQKHEVAHILARIATCGMPLDNLTASMTAQNLQHQWNQKEYFSVMHNGRSVGGTMTFGINEVIVKGVTHGQVHVRMDGILMKVAHPVTLFLPMENTSIKPTQPPRPVPVYPIHKVTEEMVKEFSSNRICNHLKAWNWSVRPRTAVARRQQMPKAIKQSKESEGIFVRPFGNRC
jgi:hypothetical protein